MRRVLATADHLGVGRRRDQTITELMLVWAEQGLVDPGDAARFAQLANSAAFAPSAAGRLDDDAVAMKELEQRLVAGLQGTVDTRRRLTAPWIRVFSRVATSVSTRTRAGRENLRAGPYPSSDAEPRGSLRALRERGQGLPGGRRGRPSTWRGP